MRKISSITSVLLRSTLQQAFMSRALMHRPAVIALLVLHVLVAEVVSQNQCYLDL
jgi:hypothetical protein